MEPLKIDQLGIENNSGNIRIKGQFLNVINSGSSNFTVKEVRSDLKVRKGLLTVVKSFLSLTAALLARFFVQKLRVDLGLYIPHIKSKGRYEVNGQVLLLPILSHGEFIAEFSKMSKKLIAWTGLMNFFPLPAPQPISTQSPKCTESKSPRMAKTT